MDDRVGGKRCVGSADPILMDDLPYPAAVTFPKGVVIPDHKSPSYGYVVDLRLFSWPVMYILFLLK
jgi:hypothetical protein